jgi:hypothetical protein
MVTAFSDSPLPTIGLLKLLQQLFWGHPPLRGEPKPEAAPWQRARAEPLEKAASAETLRGSGRLRL